MHRRVCFLLLLLLSTAASLASANLDVGFFGETERFLRTATRPSFDRVVMPTRIVGDNDAYAVHVYVGSPPSNRLLRVSFATDDLILFRDLEADSTTFYADGDGVGGGVDRLGRTRGSDIVFLGSEPQRVPIVSDPSRGTRALTSLQQGRCDACDGILGLGRGSFARDAWASVAFTPDSVVFGGEHRLLDANAVRLRCDVEADARSGSMCTTRGVAWVGTDPAGAAAAAAPCSIRFSAESPYTYLPDEMYARLMRGKNLYRNTGVEWEPLAIRAGDGTDGGTGGFLSVSFRPEDMTVAGEHGRRRLLVRRSDENDTIVLGNWAWRQHVFRLNDRDGTLDVRTHATSAHLDVANVLLFVAFLAILLRWPSGTAAYRQAHRRRDAAAPAVVGAAAADPPSSRLPSASASASAPFLVGPHAKHTAADVTYVTVVFEAVAAVLVVVALALPSSVAVLSDVPLLYVGEALLAGIMILVEALAVVATLSMGLHLPGAHPRAHALRFQLHATRGIAHKTILLVGIWVVLAQRRGEEVATFLTVLVNLYATYFYVMYGGIVSLYFASGLRRRGRKRSGSGSGGSSSSGITTFSVLAGFVLLVLGYYRAAITFFYFLRPFVERNAQIFDDLALAAIVFIYGIVSLASVFMFRHYVRGAVLRVLRARGAGVRSDGGK